MTTKVGQHNDAAGDSSRYALRSRRNWQTPASLVSVFIIAGVLAQPATAQDYLTSTGSPNFVAPVLVELGFVDASNGNLHLSIPLGSYPQRGTGQPQVISLEYDSAIWAPYATGGTPEWEPENAPGLNQLAGWYPSYQASDQVLPEVVQNCFTDWYWPDQNGTVHPFHLNGSLNNGCPNGSTDALAADSSGYHGYYSSTSGSFSVYAPDGSLVYSPLTTDSNGNYIQSKDSNGNYISETPTALYGQIDTLGRQVASGSAYVGSSGMTVSTSAGTSLYAFSTTMINVNTKFQQSNIMDNPGTQIGVLLSITLPDAAQSTYKFIYDCDESSGNAACGSPAGQSAYYGELIGITLPTGGTVRYSYEIFTDAYGNKNQWVQSRASAAGTWSYTPQVLNTCSATQYWPQNNCEQKTTVVSPAGQTVYTFQLNNGAWPATIQKEDLSNNVLSTITNTWDFSQACVLINCHGSSFIRLLSQQTTIPSASGNLTKQTSYSYDSPQYGNKTAIKEWRYIPSGNSFASVPDRATYITYLYYTATNNINRPMGVTLCNNSGSDTTNCPGGGSRVSQSLYTYDCYSGAGCTALTTISGIAQHDDGNFGSGYTARGNPTSVSRWVSGSTYLTTSYTYDTTGQILKESDPAGNITTYSYADKFYSDPGNNNSPSSYSPQNPTNAYVTSVKDVIGTQTAGYYWGSGKAAVATDYNNQSTTTHYQDGVDRQTEEIDPIGWSLASYSSAVQSDMYTAVGDLSPSSSCVSCQHTQSVLDSWGRTSSQILVNDPIGPVEVDSTFDSDGRLQTQSHPYSGSGDPNHVYETFGYDPLDRQISTLHPDNETQQVAYGPNVTSLQGTTTQQGSATTYGYGYPQVSEDESGNEKEQWLDGFGRIIEVDEPSSLGGLASSSMATNYLYDAGDRLTQVIQGGQTRAFVYDGLGRKISDNTPEGGTVTYAFTTSSGGLCSGDPSNVCRRTDARNVVSTYTYDQANRLTGVSYTIPTGQGIAAMPNVCTTTPNGTTANVCYYYDQGGASAFAKGRLTEKMDPTGSESYNHDAGGRVTQLAKVINGQTYTTGYQYNAGGDVTQMQYPSGRVVQQAYNDIGELCEIAPTATGCGDSTYYAGGFAYNAPGKLTGFTYGNGVSGAFYYSPDRAQLVYLAYAQGNSTYFNLQYSYRQSSQFSPSCPSGTAGNNGSVQCITDNVNSGRSMSYGYDPLQRVSSANSCGSSAFPKWGLSESFDRFGNRWSQTVTAGSGPSSSLVFGTNGMGSSTTNRPNGYSYDPSGNMTVEPLAPQANNMTYDGENRMTAVSGGGAGSYTYDGNGMRVVKSVSGDTTVSIFSGNSVIAEYDNGAAPGSPSREYVYNGAGDTTGLLAMFSGGATTYYHQDHLSVRLTTDGTSGSPTYGQVLSQQGHYPYGDQWYQSGPGNKWFFTSYDRDSETGLDYALARYYDSRTGTFCSADPLAGNPSDPQSWNRYPYGRNNPIMITDPSGQFWFFSLLQDIGLALAPFTGGATLALAEGAAIENTFYDIGNGQVPSPIGFGGSALGSSWNGTPWGSTSGPGSGIQGALGLPTLADIGPVFDAGQGAGAPSNPPPCVQSFANAMALDYSQPIHNGQTTQQHIQSRHMPGVGKQNVSTYWTQDFSVVRRLNFWTFLLGNQTVDSRGMTFELTFPNLRAMLTPGSGLQNGIGYDKKGNDTLTNRLATLPNCKTAVTSYPIQ